MTEATVIVGARHGGVQVAASLRQFGYAGRIVVITEDGRFSVFCFRNRKPIGVETVNQPRKHLAARRPMPSAQTITIEDASTCGFSLVEREHAVPERAAAPLVRETL